MQASKHLEYNEEKDGLRTLKKQGLNKPVSYMWLR